MRLNFPELLVAALEELAEELLELLPPPQPTTLSASMANVGRRKRRKDNSPLVKKTCILLEKSII
jgi:hypothetical protein